MLAFLRGNGLDRRDCGFVFSSQLIELMFKMAKDNALYCDGGRRDGSSAKESGDKTECEAA